MDQQRQTETTFWEFMDTLHSGPSCPDPGSTEVIQASAPEVPHHSESSTAKVRQRALTASLMEQVCEPANLNRANKACKRVKTIADFLHRLGVPKWRAWIGVLSGKGWWRRAGSPPAAEGMSLVWFESQGLVSLVQRYGQLNR